MKLSWKPWQWIVVGAAIAGCGALAAIGVMEHVASQKNAVASLLPEGALLSIEADDFAALLGDWNNSAEKRAWIQGANYEAFSRSRLFERLSQAQNEFSEVATVNTDEEILQAIAGKQSALALYDIGKLEFLYVTRMDAARVQSLPLWQARGKFERRTEAGTDFYLRKDAKSEREAAFAMRDGWLILATRQDLVAGALDRIAGKTDHNLSNEEWYANAVKEAGERGEMRMVLDLSRIVPSPYFRTYWVQRNITEMKQYLSAVSDLRRDGSVYREERVLLRRANSGVSTQSNTQSLFDVAPEDAPLAIAQVPANAAQVLAEMRENLLELRPAGSHARNDSAPSIAADENAGSAAQLDVDLSRAPLVETRTDPYLALRDALSTANVVGMLRCYETATAQGSLFTEMHEAMVLEAQENWNEDALRSALTSALAANNTIHKLGAQWQKRSSGAGDYLALDGPLPFFLKFDGKRVFVSTDAPLLEKLLARAHGPASSSPANATYLAVFRAQRARADYMHLMRQLDQVVGREPAADVSSEEEGSEKENSVPKNGMPPSFFTGSIASLSKAFERMDSEQMIERDMGGTVRQTVTYRWKN